MPQRRSPARRSRDALIAFSIHGLTACGVVLGLFGMVAVLDGDAKAALLWLVAAQVLDGIDGPLARAYDVKRHAPNVDGYVLDLVVDYVTTVVIPVAFLYKFGMLPDGLAILTCGLILFSAAIWFARTDLMTDDHWFNGFPATWNLVVGPLFLCGADPWITFAVVLLFCGLTLSNFKFVHPMQVAADRPLTLSVTVVWLAVMTIVTITFPSVPVVAKVVIIAGGAYYLWTGLLRTLRHGADDSVLADL